MGLSVDQQVLYFQFPGNKDARFRARISLICLVPLKSWAEEEQDACWVRRGWATVPVLLVCAPAVPLMQLVFESWHLCS